MSDLFLSEPNIHYKKSFQNYALEYEKINDDYYFKKYKKALDHFQDYLDDLFNYAEGKNLPQGDMAVSTFWLIDHNEVVGVVRIRHQEVEYAGHIGYDIKPDCRNKGYGSEILKLALEKAAIIGLDEVIITCSIHNTASKKIIEKNNGNLLGTVFDPEENEFLYEYQISRTAR